MTENTEGTPIAQPEVTGSLSIQSDSMFERLAKHLASQQVRFEKMPVTDPRSEVFLIHQGIEKPEIKQFAVPRYRRDHSFGSVGSLLRYLATPEHCGFDQGILFIEPGQVHAVLNYNADSVDYELEEACVPLRFTEQFQALNNLFSGVGQKDLWRLIATALCDSVQGSPDELMLIVSDLQMFDNSDGSMKIDATGLTKRNARAEVTVQCADGQRTKIPVDWTFRVRLWTATDIEVEIVTRLEINANREHGLRFTFHPKTLEEILLNARVELESAISENLPPNFTVHEGTF